MTRQIAVRLPDDLVAFLDECVRSGEATSRAAAVSKAVDRQRRDAIAMRDAEILARSALDPDDLDELARFTRRTPIDLD
jgi:Arc/MetJ-type ribon-helix-helix transcriptional regulator